MWPRLGHASWDESNAAVTRNASSHLQSASAGNQGVTAQVAGGVHSPCVPPCVPTSCVQRRFHALRLLKEGSPAAFYSFPRVNVFQKLPPRVLEGGAETWLPRSAVPGSGFGSVSRTCHRRALRRGVTAKFRVHPPFMLSWFRFSVSYSIIRCASRKAALAFTEIPAPSEGANRTRDRAVCLEMDDSGVTQESSASHELPQGYVPSGHESGQAARVSRLLLELGQGKNKGVEQSVLKSTVKERLRQTRGARLGRPRTPMCSKENKRLVDGGRGSQRKERRTRSFRRLRDLCCKQWWQLALS